MNIALFIISLLLAIASYTGMIIYQNVFLIYEKDDTQEKCVSKFKDETTNFTKMIEEKTVKDNEKYPCHIWDGKKCRKGFFDKDKKECIAGKDYIAYIIFLISLLFGIVSIISLFI